MDPVSQSFDSKPPSFSDLFRQLRKDVIAYLDAERQVYGVQARMTRRATGWIALYVLGAIVIAQGAMIALVVGLLLTLVPITGPAWATAIIVLVCLALAAILIWMIRLKLRSIKIAWRRRHAG